MIQLLKDVLNSKIKGRASGQERMLFIKRHKTKANHCSILNEEFLNMIAQRERKLESDLLRKIEREM